jgi:hypothetical protein
MTLKFKLKSLEGVDESVKALYKEVNGEFILDVEGINDGDKGDKEDKGDDAKAKELQAILKKNQELLDELKANKRAKQELEAKQKADQDAKHKADGNFEALLKSAEEKIAEKEAYIKSMVDKNNASLIDNTVMTMAAKLCDGSNVSLIKPHIKGRLGVNEKGEVQILNASGEPTVLTQEDLINEFQQNKDYAPIIRGTQSSGGGATGGSSGGAGDSKQYANTFDKLVAERENPTVKN